MPRLPRFLPPDNVYHIMSRGNNHGVIFTCDDDRRFYLERLSELKAEHPFDLYHYCLMPNHIHLQAKIYKETGFSTFVKRLNLGYYHYFRQRYGFDGVFWQGRFKSQLVSNDIYLIQCGKYIELNPVRAGIVKQPEDYQWSSYTHYAFGKSDSLVTDDILYNEMGRDQESRQENYKKLIINEVVEQSYGKKDQIALGSRDFRYNANRKLKYHLNDKTRPYRKSRA